MNVVIFVNIDVLKGKEQLFRKLFSVKRSLGYVDVSNPMRCAIEYIKRR